MTAEASRQRWSEPEIDFSTFPGKDGKPMADTERNQREMINTMFALRQPLEPLGHHVGGNLIIYYNPENGLDHLSPDVFVALDRDAGLRESWKTWLEGKFPEVVVEIASPSTQQRDIGEKRARYGALGAREYYIHDPARRLQPAFRGYRAAGGALLPVPNPSGLSIRSEVLGLEFRVVDGWLRVIDPASGSPYPTPDEARDLQRTAERARHKAERGRAAAEQAQRHAEARALGEEIARRDAERALRNAEERALQEEIARRDAEQAQRHAEERTLREATARGEAEQGRLDAEGRTRAMVLKIVTRRFGNAPAGLATRLAGVADPEQLDLLADAALAAASLEMFLQLLGGEDRS